MTGSASLIPDNRDEFLVRLRLRNAGLIADADQRRLGDARIAVAGCGSTGGAVVEPLVRAGAMRLELYEPGAYELDNLNRQRATLDALGRNKAEWLAEHARRINPYASIVAHAVGVHAGNVEALCRDADLVFDAIDVTSMDGLNAKFILHERAVIARRPVITAYDLAYRQYIRVFDYRVLRSPFAGRLDALRRVTQPMDALALLVPLWAIPRDLASELERLHDNPGVSISQLGCASDLFGAIAVPLVIELLASRAIKPEFVLDLKDAMLPARARAVNRAATIVQLARLKLRMLRER